MTIKESLHQVTSFAAMILSANKIHQTIATEQGLTGQEYIGATVLETFPNGSKREAVVMKVEWCSSCGLNGNWLLYIAYTDEKSYIPGAWVGKDVLTLVGSE